MTIKETKERMIDFLRTRGEYYRPVDDVMYNIRCPFCGDTQKKFNEGHFYIKIDLDSSRNMPFICFKCDERGIITPNVLDELLCNDAELRKGIQALNEKCRKGSHIKDDNDVSFEFIIPEFTKNERKGDYINHRLGISFSDKDYVEMNWIPSLKEFVYANNIRRFPFRKEFIRLLEKDYVGFLSSGNSHILFRDVTDTHPYPWIKYPILPESKQNKIFYTISDEVDIFDSEDIIVNLSEGVMDAIGVAYHFDHIHNNSINIALTNKFYSGMLFHIVGLGIMGNHVIVNIFSDNDDTFNKHDGKKSTTSTKYYRQTLANYKYIFKEVNIYHNIKSKDYGVPKDNIILKKERL